MLALESDVLVIGGGMAAAWAAIGAAQEGARVLLVDKGYLGTSGVTATAGPGHWFFAPEKRAAAIAQREAIAHGIADSRWMERILDQTFRTLPTLEGHYKFGLNDQGVKLYGPVRGPEYMRALRAKCEEVGVRILDHSPVLELLLHTDSSVAGARGVRRQVDVPFEARAAGVILATGGCAFFSHLLGSTNNTGDGYLMASEAGVPLSGMEFSNQYVVAPAFSAVTRTMSYAWATYYDASGKDLGVKTHDGGTRALARHLLQGPVYCDFSRMPEDIRERLPRISPNVMIPFRRRGIDPFRDRFPVTLHAEGTVRGMGGIQIADEDCQTRVPGLYAAGDAASRELVTGASSGGGAVNSAWALSSGTWSGRAAARRAKSIGSRADRPVEAIGQAGLRPRRARHALEGLLQRTQDEILPYDKNLFRRGSQLAASLRVLDQLWQEARDHLQDENIVRSRETASVIASARFAYHAALHRRESRGMHQREDAPHSVDAYQERQIVSGLDQIRGSFDERAPLEQAV